MKLIGLATVAAVALIAFVGPAPVSATVLCKNNSSTSACSETYGSGQVLEASLSGGTATLETLGGTVFDTCKGGALKAKTTNTGGASELVKANVETLSWTECTKTTDNVKVGSLEISWITGSDNGTLSTNGTEVTINTVFGTCVYGSTSSLALGTLIGGNPATISINTIVPKISGNAACPAESRWTAGYTFTSPKPLYVASAAGGGATATSLTTSLSGEAKSGEEITVNEGAKVKDTATLSGTNASKATGTVKYKVYANKECKELVTSAGEVTVSGGKVPASEEKELEAGRAYYWQAEYSGDSNNLKSTSTCSKEVLTVKAKTSLTTSLSGEAKSGEEITILGGSKAKDTATLSGTKSSTAAGKVKFKVYKDKECKEFDSEAGEGSLGEGKASSEEKTLEAGAVYYWQAEYPGDSLHQAATSTCGKEVLTVKAATSLSTTLSGEGHSGAELEVEEGAPVADSATLSGTNASKATGKVKYAVYEDEACKELAASAGEVSVSGTTAPASEEVELPDGVYYWQASYEGNATHSPSESACGSEIEIVAEKTTLTTLLLSEGGSGAEIEVDEGAVVNDTATLGGSKSGEASGTIKYAVYSDEDCEEIAAEAGSFQFEAGEVPPSGGVELDPGVYYWQAVYFGDESNQYAVSDCGTEIETINPPSLSTTLSGEGKSGEEIEIAEASTATDTAVLNTENASTATGTIEYAVYSDSACEDLVSLAGEAAIAEGVIPPSDEVGLPDGIYYWQARYSGDLSHEEAISSCGSEIEVVAEPTSLTTALSGGGKSGAEVTVKDGAPVSDSAELSGEHSAEATGLVEYRVFKDSSCEELAAVAGSVEVSGQSAPASEPMELEPGTYYWQAQYTGDALNQQATSTCGIEVEHVTVADLTNELSGGGETGSEIDPEEGIPVTDTATLHEENAATATGTVKYMVYEDGQCKEPPVAEAGEVTVSKGVIPASSTESLPEGTYYWQAEYSGDGTHEEAVTACGKAVEKVNVPWVVSVGDSYISGEGGRWAGNVAKDKQEYKHIDALGDNAYKYHLNEESAGEAIPRCHRSETAEIFIGYSLAGFNPRVNSRNFACSGAKAASESEIKGWVPIGLLPGLKGRFISGLDFAQASFGHLIGPGKGRCPISLCEGQAKLLEDFARERKEHDEQIKMVVVSIGGNNFEFPKVVHQCVTAFIAHSECESQEWVAAQFKEPALAARQQEIEQAIENVGMAMETAGFDKFDYTIVVQNYPSAIPAEETEFRYASDATRLEEGGCGVGNNDAHWANAVALKAINETVKKAVNGVDPGGGGKYDLQLMNVEEAFKGRRLCEQDTKLVNDGPNPKFPDWTYKGAVDETEWVNQIRLFPKWPQLQQEDFHPNYWGQLALRNCLRQVYNNGSPLGGKCTIKEKGVTKPPKWGTPPSWTREPIMKLTY